MASRARDPRRLPRPGQRGAGASSAEGFRLRATAFQALCPNAAFFDTMLVAFFLYESFKQDVCAPVDEPVCYATTLRRRVMDMAAKIVRHGRRVVLKVTTATFEALHFERLWHKSGAPPRYCWGEGKSSTEEITYK
ncbi:hypothetical protein [Desulfosoma caldarium]|uniref:hypothetical protein n=1 Tax=Desulfosoma caldarium TaxID=610254 RepID=UPI0011CD7482|nr:hypothetical protein [Desulfosoma caldarium]